MARDFIDITIKGDREVLRAIRQLPDDGRDELAEQMRDVSQELAVLVRAAGRADTPQSARAAETVRAEPGIRPQVVAGPEAKRRLMGSEFGIKRRTGWYGRKRYQDSEARQYRPHRGSASYWFFRTQEENAALIDSRWREVADTVVRQWSA